MLRFNGSMLGRSPVLFALLLGNGCSEPAAPQSTAVDTKQQKQLQDLEDEVNRLRLEAAEKKAEDAAAVKEFERIVSMRPATPSVTVTRPTEAERNRASVLSSIEDLTFDDRKIATALYEKIDSNVLSLNAKEAEYATCGNGSSALARPFAEGLLTVLKQGVPNEHWIESNEFGHDQFNLRRTQDNWHLPLILSAAAKLKLDDEFEIMSLCRLCFSERGSGLSKLNKHLPLLIRRNPKERNRVIKFELDHIKRERLFKHLLEDYLQWADSPEADQQQIQEEELVKDAENERQAKITEFNQRAGMYATRSQSEREKKAITEASADFATRLSTQSKQKLSYSVIVGYVRKFTKASDSFPDRRSALSNLSTKFLQIGPKVYGLNGEDVDEKAKKNAADALSDFDAGLLLIFPALTSSTDIVEFLADVESGELIADDATSDSLSDVMQIRKDLVKLSK